MNYKYIAEVAALAGLIMLESNAECYRVEDTVSRILKTSALPTSEVFANTTGLFITLDGPQLHEPITFIKRITTRGTHLRKIYKVNQISRQLTSGRMSIEQAHDALITVDASEYNVLSKNVSTFILVLSFAILLGGNWVEILLSGVAAFILIGTYYLRDTFKLNDFIFGIIATLFVGSIMSIIVQTLSLTDHSYDITIISTLMPLFPGTAFTNGFRDSFKGDYNAGIAKIVEALMIAASLGLGIAFGLIIAKGVLAWGMSFKFLALI